MLAYDIHENPSSVDVFKSTVWLAALMEFKGNFFYPYFK